MPAIHILHVEDDPNDTFLVQRALREAGNMTVECVADGDRALDYLDGVGPYADRVRYPLPDVILLDLRLGSMHGLDLLAWARSDPRFQGMPIIVLSGCAKETDLACARQLGADSFFAKTPLYRGLAEAILEVLSGRPASRLTSVPRPEIPAALLGRAAESTRELPKARM